MSLPHFPRLPIEQLSVLKMFSTVTVQSLSSFSISLYVFSLTIEDFLNKHALYFPILAKSERHSCISCAINVKRNCKRAWYAETIFCNGISFS